MRAEDTAMSLLIRVLNIVLRISSISLICLVAAGHTVSSPSSTPSSTIANDSNALLDCSPQLRAAGLLSGLNELNFSAHQAALEDVFLDSVLHECFRAHPYNTQQLPLPAGARVEWPLELEFMFSFNNLLSLNNDGTMEAQALFEFAWRDQFRQWDTQKLPIQSIRVPANELWYPTLYLEGCEDDPCFIKPHNETRLLVESNGRVSYFVNRKFRANCAIHLANFPYDNQCCQLNFILLDYSADRIVVVNWNGSIHDHPHVDHEEWKFLFSEKSEFIRGSVSSDETIAGYRVDLHFIRYSNFYMSILIVPVAVISMIGLFTLFLPVDSNDRLNLSVNVLLGFLFLQSVIASHIPKSDKSPLLSSFLVGSLVLSGFNVVVVSLLVEVYNTGEKTGLRKNSTIRRFLERLFAARILNLFTLCTFSTCTRLVHSFRRRRPCLQRSRSQLVSLRLPAGESVLSDNDNEHDELRVTIQKLFAHLPPIPPRDFPEYRTEPSPTIPQRDSTRVEERLLPPNGAVSIDSEQVSEPRVESVQSTELTIGIPFRGPKKDHSSMGFQSNSSIAPIRLVQMSDDRSAISPRPPHLFVNNSVPERGNREDEQPHEDVGTEQVTQGEVEAGEAAAKEREKESEMWLYFALLLDRLHCIVYIVAQLLLVVVYLHPIWHKRSARPLERF